MDIHIAHAFDGVLGTYFEEIVEKFNENEEHQALGYRIKTSCMTNYSLNVDNALEHLEKNDGLAPHLVLVPEYKTGDLLTRNVTIPVGNFISQERLDDIAELVHRTFSNADNVLFSLPFNPSCGVLYINRDMLNQAGYAPHFVPRTFAELKTVSNRLVESGFAKNGWTTAWVAAYLVEIRKAQMGLPLALPNNGLDGTCDKLCVNEGPIEIGQVKAENVLDQLIEKGLTKYGWLTAWVASYLQEIQQIQKKLSISLAHKGLESFCRETELGMGDIEFFRDLKEQQRTGAYIYSGNTNDSKDSFVKGLTAFYMQGGNQYQNIRQLADFHLDVAPLPAYGEGKKYALPLGGASFWVLNNVADRIKEVKAVLDYFSSPDVQMEWHEKTSYVPVSKTAIERLRAENFYQTHPVHASVVEQTLDSELGKYSLGNRIPNYAKIREEIVKTIHDFLQSDETDPKPFLDKLAIKGVEMANDR